MPTPLRARQVHLDFHTSEHIPSVGEKFNKKQFQKALKLGHVNSITVFAKCHHGLSYYPTKVGTIHPHLERDLMGEQIEAAHAIGVRAPIYYTVGWSDLDTKQHPEWLAKNKDGTVPSFNFDAKAKPEDKKATFSWQFLCIATGYRDHMLAEVRDICDRYPVDGFFFDICMLWACYNDTCRELMAKAGVDIENQPAVYEWYVKQWELFFKDCRAVIAEKHPEATVFFNGRAEINTPQPLLDQQTHLELEDLPTTWGGYDKFPLRAKGIFAQNKAYLAMSGKFHTAWGEFGGFKHPDAIKYEAASMIAWGAACSMGDQLHPSGEADMSTYSNIGQAFSYVEQIEGYGLDSSPHASLGFFASRNGVYDEGLARMLLESQIDFEVVSPLGYGHSSDQSTDLSRYETIILPGTAFLSAPEADRLNAYVKNGGSLLIIGESALDSTKSKLLFDIGATYVGPGEFDCDYTVVGKELGFDLVKTPFLNYAPAIKTKATKGKVLATIHEPYFSRTYGHYCSHQNTANQVAPAAHPAVVQNGRIIFLAHSLSEQYFANGARVHRQLLINALKRLHKKPRLAVTMPSGGRVNLVHQPQHRRYVAHLLYALPVQRGRCSVIEDLVPLYDVPLQFRLKEKIKKISLPLSGKKLTPKAGPGGVLSVSVPVVQCHQMVVAQY